MPTLIGQRLRDAPRRSGWAVAFVVVLVLMELVILTRRHSLFLHSVHWWLTTVALMGLIWFNEGDLVSIGFRGPQQGWMWWAKSAIVAGMAIGIAGTIWWGVWNLLVVPPRFQLVRPRAIVEEFLWMCILVPLQEELLYRLALCGTIAARFGPWAAIIGSNLAFAAAHIVTGHASPENQLGGLILAWAYLHSESLLVPLALHSAGNACALCAQVGMWINTFGWS